MSSQSNQKNINVLVVEDEADLREILVYVLEDIGYTVFSAENGELGFNILSQNTIDAVITDVRMPKLDGIQLLKKIRFHNKEKPIVFITTGFADLDESEAFKIGANEYLTKPYDINDMTSKLKKYFLASDQQTG